MDKRQKSALRSTYRQLADELILDEDFYAALKQNKIFTDSMIGIIKAEITPRDRVYMLLELLEKRGPKAFDKFVQILMENYDWLAEKLQEEFNQRRQTSLVQANHGLNVRRFPYDHQQSLPCLELQLSGTNHDHYRFASQSNTPRFYGMSQPMLQYPAPASYIENGQKFFTYPMPTDTYNIYQGYDSTDHPGQPKNSFAHNGQNMVHERNGDGNNSTEGQHQRKDVKPSEYAVLVKHPKQKCKDACISPIGVIESPRKDVSKGERHSSGANNKTPDYKDESAGGGDEISDHGFDEIRSQSTAMQDLSNDANSEINDVLDGPENIRIALETARSQEPMPINLEAVDDNSGFDDEVHTFPSSEVFYGCVRRGSSCMSNLPVGILQKVADMQDQRNKTQIYADDETEFDYEVTRSDSSIGENAEQFERMKSVYYKLVSANTGSEDIEEDGENIVSWEMIDDELDKLINAQRNSDDNKLLKACLEKFPEKERRQPLNICIENLFEEKRHLLERFNEKSKEIDRMVYDMWNHQQDMKNIEKLKKQRDELLAENGRLKDSIQNTEVSLNEQRLIAAQMELKVQSLEQKHREEKEKRGQTSNRRGLNLHGNRQQLNCYGQGQSPKRTQPEPKLQHALSSPTLALRNIPGTSVRRTLNTKR